MTVNVWCHTLYEEDIIMFKDLDKKTQNKITQLLVNGNFVTAKKVYEAAIKELTPAKT
jgi:hypothetical protein